MTDFVHDAPATRVVFGIGARHRAADEVGRLGAARVLLVHGEHERGYAEEIAAQLGAAAAGRFTGVAMHVPVATARAATAGAREASADCLLAVGGGSAIGTAKAVALETGLPILAVPTTYAGSEMTPIWGLTDDAGKTTGRDPRVLPRTVLYDPEVTLSLPPDVSAASGMNAMAHLVEALYATGASPLTLVAAEEGVRALAAGLPRVVADPADLVGRTEALTGAWLGGWALAAGAMGLHHRLCHVLGGTWGLPHAPTHAALLPYVADLTTPAAPEAMRRVRRGLAAAGRRADSAAAGLWDLGHDLGAPTSLAVLGFASTDVARAAELVAQSPPPHPRPVDPSAVRAVLEAALAGKRPG